MGLRGGGASNHKGYLKPFLLHFSRDIGHFFKGRCNESRQTNNVDLLFTSHPENVFAVHHDAQIDNFIVVALQHNTHNVFTNVVDIAFDSGQQYFAVVFCGAGLLFLNERL